MSSLSFQMPDAVLMEQDGDTHGVFVFKPLEKGYGVTIGNALRRVLLSSLEGSAIVSVKFQDSLGVLHEFSTIKGIVEDVTEIILNLKEVRFKRTGQGIDSEKINVRIQGQDVFRAGDIYRFTNAYEILNPDLLICHMEKFVDLQLELTVQRGRGYVPAEEHKSFQERQHEVGLIPVDAIFTPIRNVKYLVEDTRVERRTDYEKLTVELSTDGSIHPREALHRASGILVQHLRLFSEKGSEWRADVDQEAEFVDESVLRMRKLLNTTLEHLDLSARAYNCLKAAEVKTLGDMVRLRIEDLMKFRNFGKKSLTELKELVSEKELSFGMDVSKYRLQEDDRSSI
ncbi:MAG: DNA-directed RNA polymerase subunit alpha [Cytophagales bacterium]|nr:DNA-directed RNA polymerase subunit alpha [Cytophagales bacterium]